MTWTVGELPYGVATWHRSRSQLAFRSFFDDWASVGSRKISCHTAQMWSAYSCFGNWCADQSNLTSAASFKYVRSPSGGLPDGVNRSGSN